MSDWIDGPEFDAAMQAYRWADPHNPDAVSAAFEAVKATVRAQSAQVAAPVAWRWPVKKLRGVEWRYRKTLPQHESAQPLYAGAPPVAAPGPEELLIREARFLRTGSDELNPGETPK